MKSRITGENNLVAKYAISGIYAAELERLGIGTLAVEGRDVVFRQCDGLSVAWECGTERRGLIALAVFRLAAAKSLSIH